MSGCAEPRDPKPFATLANDKIDESSGLAASAAYPGVFWTHNDSGGKARIFPIVPGKTPEGPGFAKGVKVKGAKNKDWETIAALPGGKLAVGDTGNNWNRRDDLRVYIVPEPDPYRDKKVKAERVIRFRYPDQPVPGEGKKNFDCEAMFYRNGSLFLLTKHRDDDRTTLYRFPELTAASVVLQRIADFPVGGRVTGADASPDGSQVAVVTIGSLWLFEGIKGDDIFQGKKRKRALKAGQSEAVAFDGKTLLVTNEEGELFRIDPEEMEIVE